MKILILLLFFSSVASASDFVNYQTIEASKFNYFINLIKEFSGLNLNNVQENTLITKESIINIFSNLEQETPDICHGFNTSLLSNTIQANEINSLFLKAMNCSVAINAINSGNIAIDHIVEDNLRIVSYDNKSWVVDDGFILDTEVSSTINIYYPEIPNNKVILYAHPVGETNYMTSEFALNLKNLLNNLGYTIASIEFRHPIMEDSIVNLESDQWDLIKALKYIRKYPDLFNLTNIDDISVFARSKGTLILSNILNGNMTDMLGNIKIQKMYLYDAQITYNYDQYTNWYMSDTGSTTCSTYGINVTMDFEDVNTLFYNSGGMYLSYNPNIVDFHVANLNLPILRLGYTHPNIGKFDTAWLINDDCSLRYGNVDYLIHNPMSIDIMCNQYTGECSGQDRLGVQYNDGYDVLLNDINSFFNYL